MKYLIRLTTCTIFLLIFVLSHKNVHAKQVIFHDDFSNGLEKWSFVRGGEALWSIENGAAKAFVDRGNTITEITPKNEYWGKNWCNLDINFDFYPSFGVDRNLSFRFKDLNNWYEIHFVSTFFEVVKIKNGMVNWSKRTNYVLENNRSYKVRILLNNEIIRLYLNEQKIYEEIDVSFSSIDCGKISLKAGTGASFPTQVFFDNVVVYDLDAPDIKEAPLVKQNDPAWAQTEYDSAKQWSVNPSISRWGCALTSSVMILKAHGINSLPSAENLDPASLNEWLKKQPDGYFPNGLINWLAIGRLTKQLSSVLNTPTLEYKRINYSNNWLQDVLNQIDHQKPVILELPGHFLVADNYTTDKSDLLIKDPFYSYTNFSQHQKMPQSIRVFTPSQTDLSYIIVAVDEKVDLKIEDVDIATHSAQASEYLTTLDENPEQNEQSKKIKIISLEKPALGNYQISLTQPNFSQINLTIFTYDQNGEVKDLSTNIYVGQTPVQYTLQYTKSQDDTLKRKADFSTFKELIKELGLAQEITKPAVEIWLDYFATLAETQSLNNQVRYISLLKETVGWFENKMSSVAKNVLLQELWEIKNNLQQL